MMDVDPARRPSRGNETVDSGVAGMVAKTEATLFGAIRELNDLSWKLRDIVYETKPDKPTKELEQPVPADKITDARNRIMESNGRITDAIKKLEGIGK